MGDAPADAARYDAAPTIAIIADNEAGRRRGNNATEAMEARAVYSGEPSDAVGELPRRAAVNAVFVDLERDHGATLDALLAYLQSAAEAERFRSVVSIPADLIDIVAAQCHHRDIALVSPADPEAIAAELGFALRSTALQLSDSNAERDEARLLRLSEEAGRIARALAELSRSDARLTEKSANLSAPPSEYRGEPPKGEAIGADQIRSMIRLRRLRDRFFDGTLFADPAWDMLLDLMAARIEGRQVSVSSLCIAGAVPPTTALRWIKAMTDRGLFVRHADPHDGRRVFIALGDEAAHAMEAWFAAARASENFPAV